MHLLAAALTSLVITVWPGAGDDSYTRTLRCPSASPDCRALARVEDPFRPIPETAICTANYGGPQRALVRGTFRGRRIWTRFARRNGCEIARWDRHKFLFDRRG
jgi:hypothetical protein